MPIRRPPASSNAPHPPHNLVHTAQIFKFAALTLGSVRIETKHLRASKRSPLGFGILMVASVSQWFIAAQQHLTHFRQPQTPQRGQPMRGLKTILCTSVLLAFVAMTQAVQAQVVVSVGIQPVCSYGYYDYAPYACSPMGFYGPGYFYNGIFLGMGPWAGWGYGHGWGSHRFVEAGGGSYRGGGGAAAARGHYGGGSPARGQYARGGAARSSGAVRSNSVARPAGARPSAAHAPAGRTTAPHAAASHAAEPHAAAPRGGGAAHAGGGAEHK